MTQKSLRRQRIYPKDSTREPERGIIAWRSGLAVLEERIKLPSTVTTLMLTILSAFTFAPYYGGQTVHLLAWSVDVPPLSSQTMARAVALATPVAWLLLIVPAYRPDRSALPTVIVLVSAGMLIALFLAWHVGIRSSSTTADFQELTASVLSPRARPTIESGWRRYFISEPIELKPIASGSGVFLETVDVSATVRITNDVGSGGFDLWVVLAPDRPLDSGNRGMDDVFNDIDDIVLHAPKAKFVVLGEYDQPVRDAAQDLIARIDFQAPRISVESPLFSLAKRKALRGGTVAAGTTVYLQLFLWSGHGIPGTYTLEALNVKVRGRGFEVPLPTT